MSIHKTVILQLVSLNQIICPCPFEAINPAIDSKRTNLKHRIYYGVLQTGNKNIRIVHGAVPVH
jgi:hypothetical protein